MVVGDVMKHGEGLRKRREQVGLTQSELAEQIGCSRVTVARWETNQAKPQGSHRRLLTSILAINDEGPQSAYEDSWAYDTGTTGAIDPKQITYTNNKNLGGGDEENAEPD